LIDSRQIDIRQNHWPYVCSSTSTGICHYIKIFNRFINRKDEKPVMVHGAGIQVAVIRVLLKSYHSLLGMWQQQPIAREC